MSGDQTFDIATTPCPEVKTTPKVPHSTYRATRVTTTPQEANDATMEETPLTYVPPPRLPTITKIAFTPRLFPTPVRESKAAEEDDWLVKNKRHLTSHQGINAKYAAKISDTDPLWLKAKATEFFTLGDYQSASAAYTEAYETDPTLLSCVSNRAACAMHLGAFDNVRDDCDLILAAVMDIASSHNNTPLNAEMTRLRQKALIRRGVAYCQLGLYREATADLSLALVNDPQPGSPLATDVLFVQSLAAATAEKTLGDTQFRATVLEEAVIHYTRGITHHSGLPALYSNRAAAYLALAHYQACVDDCTAALSVIEQQLPTRTTETRMVLTAGAAIPAVGSEARRVFVLTTLTRRGMAYQQLTQLEKAQADFDAVDQLKGINRSEKSILSCDRGNKSSEVNSSSVVTPVC